MAGLSQEMWNVRTTPAVLSASAIPYQFVTVPHEPSPGTQ